MPAQYPKEIMMEGSKKHYVDEPRQSSPTGLIIRQKEPANLEMPFDQVDSYLTPTELFYIRSHFPAPKIDAADYRLRIDGAVGNPLAVSYQELREMPSATRTATLECARNGRVCHCKHCWSGPAWRTMRAKSCSKELIAASRRKNPYLRVRSPMPAACPGRRQFSRKS